MTLDPLFYLIGDGLGVFAGVFLALVLARWLLSAAEVSSGLPSQLSRLARSAAASLHLPLRH